VPIRNGAVLLNTSQRELFEELTTYPHAAHDDLADALAMGVEYLLNRPNPRLF
jgi:predicted phage terminase large subunit-like protein